MLITLLVGSIRLFIALIKPKVPIDKPLVLLGVGAFIMFTLGPVSGLFQSFSRNWTMSEADTVIDALEMFHSDSSYYPDSLLDLVPEYIQSIPEPSIIGTNKFHYENQDTTYELHFTQLLHITSALEFVTYHPDTLLVENYTNRTVRNKHVGTWSW